MLRTTIVLVPDETDDLTLTVDFAGEVHVLHPGQELTFGRGQKNDIVIDDNPRLHRYFGHIFFRNDSWWLLNTGSKLPMGVGDQASRSQATLTSRREISLSFEKSIVSFTAGSTSYEVLLTLASHTPEVLLSDNLDLTTTGLTMDRVPLVGDQRLLAIAMCELALRNPHERVDVPSNQSIAHRFGWPKTTLNRKLDRLCRYYADLGVKGLVGGPGQVATDRRQRLVAHLVSTGEIGLDDLSELDADDESPGSS